MNKITKEIRYKDMSFNLIREVKDIKMYIEKGHCDYCIIVDKDDVVLFEIRADCAQNHGFLEDANSG